MKTWLLGTWDALRSSFWFMPTTMAVFFAGMAFVVTSIDRRLEIELRGPLGWLHAGSPQSVRTMLSTIVGSIITVLSVVFSITIVTLTLAAQQFGPRLIRNFMRDRGNQFVLGTFISTFVYCLLVMQLADISDNEEQVFLPHLSIMLALVLTLSSLGVLIYFIHHMAESIQAPYIVAGVARNLCDSIDAFYPDPLADVPPTEPPQDELLARIQARGGTITSRRSGYVQAIDYEALIELAQTNDLTMMLCYRPGQFIAEGAAAARTWPATEVTAELRRAFQHAVLVGIQRTDTQDIEYEIFQLVEVALRAMSPSINDPFTAMNCIDQLGSALIRLAQRRFPSRWFRDHTGELRVIARFTNYTGTVNAAFDQLRQVGCGHVDITLRLLETASMVAEHLRTYEQKRAVQRQVEMIYRSAMRAIHEEDDRRDIMDRYERALNALACETSAKPL